MEADAVPKVFELSPWALTKHAPCGETIAHAASKMKGEGKDQVAAPRTKAGEKTEH